MINMTCELKFWIYFTKGCIDFKNKPPIVI